MPLFQTMSERSVFVRVPKDLGDIDWDKITQVWDDEVFIRKNLKIDRLFFDSLVNSYKEDPRLFINELKEISEHTFEDESPKYVFFSNMKNIFCPDKAKEFVELYDLSLERIETLFGKKAATKFLFILHLYQAMILSVSLEDYQSYSTELCFILGRLMVPSNLLFYSYPMKQLETFFMSPITYSMSGSMKTPAFFILHQSGRLSLLEVSKHVCLLDIEAKNYTYEQKDTELLLYDSEYEPVYRFIFPSSEDCYGALIALIDPPSNQFMQMLSFLRTSRSFLSLKTFFQDIDYQIPELYKSEIQKCVTEANMELLFYVFALPAPESKVNRDNIDQIIDLISSKFVPFFRALIQFNWDGLATGDIVLRQNGQYPYLCTAILKKTGGDYINRILSKLVGILNSASGKLKHTNFDAADAEVFINDIFLPMVNTFLDGVDEIPLPLRQIIRSLIVRTSSHYINQKATLLIIPNLFLLRYILPTYHEKVLGKFTADPPLQKAASIAGNSLLSLFYQNGWFADKDPELAKYNHVMEDLYPKTVQYVLNIINCEKVEYKWPETDRDAIGSIDLLINSAEHLIYMDLPDANKHLYFHYYSTSFMQSVEEGCFDFKKVRTGIEGEIIIADN